MGLWEGPPLLVCFSLLLLRTFTSIHQLSSPSIHPLPPFYDLFLGGFCSVHPDLYPPPPLSLPRCGTRSACIPLVSTPRHLSFSRRLCLSVGNWQDGKRGDTERVKSRSGLNRKSRRKGEKCSCSSSAFTVSRCCCWLDVIRWDSVGENRFCISGKTPKQHLYPHLSVPPPRKRIAFLTSFSRLLCYFSFWECRTLKQTTHALKRVSVSPPTLSHRSLSIQKVWKWEGVEATAFERCLGE